MAKLSYGGLDLGILLRTLDLEVEAVKDPSDTDVLYYRWTVTVQTVVSPAGLTLASRTGQSLPGLQGDRLGVTLANLTEFLNTPRKQVVFTLGDDQVVKSPDDDPAKNRPYPCDPSGTGPTPHAKVIDFRGDKTALLQFRVVFHTQKGFNNVLLSNRWSVRSSIARDGRTVRVVTGVAIVRADLLRAKQFDIDQFDVDQFRQSFITQPPPNFIRTAGEVLENEDGTELHYWFTDEERTLQLGSDGQGCEVIDITGNYTAGVESPLNTIGGRAFAGANAVLPEGAMAALLGGLFGPVIPSAAGAGVVPIVGDAMPVAKANFQVQLKAQPDADRKKMVQLALDVAFDRFAPLEIGKTFFLVSIYVTCVLGVSEQLLVEVRGELLPVNENALTAILHPEQVTVLMNLSQEIRRGAANLVRSGLNPSFQGAGGTRGTYLGTLLPQTLGLPGELPAAPRGNVTNPDLPVR